MSQYRLGQIETEKDLTVAPGPVKGSQFAKRFYDWFQSAQAIYNGKLFKQIPQVPQNVRTFIDQADGELRTTHADPFYHNAVAMKEYYDHLAEDKLYSGMFEAIGRVTIYASQFLQNPFAKFIKDPLMHGNAHMAGLFEPIRSHDWKPDEVSNQYGVDKVMGVDNVVEDEAAGHSKLYNMPDTGWLFRAERPKFISTVSRINFSREVALLVNARDYARYCQTPEMVGDIGASLMGMSHAVYMNDMREASKNFFCGVIRAKEEPVAAENYGPEAATNIGPDFDDKMLDRVIIDHAELRAAHQDDLEGRGKVIADGVSRLIHNTVEVDFADFTDLYNPQGLDRFSERCTAILDANIRYDTFKKYYATLHHPEFIKPGPTVEFTWINKFPRFGTAIYPSEQEPIRTPDNIYKWWELVGMVVDDNAMAIIPYQQPVTVQTWYDPHREAMSIFTHYQCDFEFKPFFNRKYIFLEHRDDRAPANAERILECT